jgi:hypothetical protein
MAGIVFRAGRLSSADDDNRWTFDRSPLKGEF